jgi:hypothetical protein
MRIALLTPFRAEAMRVFLETRSARALASPSLSFQVLSHWRFGFE